MTRDATALKQRADIAQKLDVECTWWIGLQSGQPIGIFGGKSNHGCEIGRLIAGLTGHGISDGQRLLAMGMATAAVISYFPGPELVPGLGHGEHEAILIEHLESE